MRILVVCIFIHQFASLTVLRRRHSVVSDKRETTLGRQLSKFFIPTTCQTPYLPLL
jgi:hypothetical protein